MIKAALTGLVFLSIFALLFDRAYRYAMADERTDLFEDKWIRRIFVLFSALGLALCIHLLIQNRFVYYWDYGGYWTSSYLTMKSLFKAPLDTVRSVYQSVLKYDYNNILPLVISVPLKAFGYTFPRYVVVNFLLFLVPAWAVLVSVIWKILSRYEPSLLSGKKKYLTFIFTVFLTALFTPFYYAMLRGYIDAACLIPSSLAILLFVDYNGLVLDRRQLVRDIFISLCLLVSFLFRRYFAYFAVGYGAALCLYSVYQVISARRSSGWGETIRNAVMNLAAVGAIAAGILLLFFRPLAVRALTGNYANAYEGYDAPLPDKVNGVAVKFGLITFILAGAAIGLCILTKKARKLTLFCAVSAAVTTAAFFRVQSMDDHHIYTIAPSIFILMALGIVQICALFRQSSYRFVCGIAAAAILGIGAANCYFPSARRFIRPFAGIYAQQYNPLQRGDLDELHHVANDLNKLTEGTDDWVYICASGDILNSSVMGALNEPYSEGAVHNLYWTANVDLRDGFPAGFLRAKYVVVTDPVQLHLAEGTQEAVRFPNQEVQNADSPIGRHFRKLPGSFVLDNDVKAYIYQKTSDFERSDLQYLADYYSKLYPGKDGLFTDVILHSQDD